MATPTPFAVGGPVGGDSPPYLPSPINAEPPEPAEAAANWHNDINFMERYNNVRMM